MSGFNLTMTGAEILTWEWELIIDDVAVEWGLATSVEEARKESIEAWAFARGCEFKI